jgi:hypothetical protein
MLLKSSDLRDMWFEGKLGRHFIECIITEKLDRTTKIIFSDENLD